LHGTINWGGSLKKRDSYGIQNINNSEEGRSEREDKGMLTPLILLTQDVGQ